MAAPDPIFQGLMERWRCRSERIAEYMTGNATHPRQWHDPPDWDGDPFEIEALHPPFDRDQLNAEAEAEYTAATDAEGTIGRSMGKEIQLGHLMMQERAFRLRQMSLCRAQMHGCGRRMAHGEYDGIWTDLITNYVQDMLDSGSTGA